MTQPTTTTINGTPELLSAENALPVVPGKRKRDSGDEHVESKEEEDQTSAATNGLTEGKKRELVKSYLEVLTRYGPFFDDVAALLAHCCRPCCD